MLEAFSSPPNRNRSLIFLTTCGLLAIAAVVVGIDDNPIGITLAALSAASFVLAFAHAWRTSAQFWRLALACVLGFFVLVALGIVLQILMERTGLTSLVGQILGFVGTAFLLVAAFLCIPGFLIGILGALLMRKRERGKRPAA